MRGEPRFRFPTSIPHFAARADRLQASSTETKGSGAEKEPPAEVAGGSGEAHAAEGYAPVEVPVPVLAAPAAPVVEAAGWSAFHCARMAGKSTV